MGEKKLKTFYNFLLLTGMIRRFCHGANEHDDEWVLLLSVE
jgi:hypothetical protein